MRRPGAQRRWCLMLVDIYSTDRRLAVAPPQDSLLCSTLQSAFLPSRWPASGHTISACLFCRSQGGHQLPQSSNSPGASPPPSERVGRTRGPRRDPRVELEVTLSHFWVVLSVLDSGPGIAPAKAGTYHGVLFFTPKPVGKGTGPGLSISRSIALEHLGTLELNPESPHTCSVSKLPLTGGA
jgi:hypothetical protein